jgi:hypothetical protein
LLENGLDGVGEALHILVNEAAKIERTEYLGVQPYERTATRRANTPGFKPKTMLTRLGEVTFQVPQVRTSDFYPSALEKGSRTDRALSISPWPRCMSRVSPAAASSMCCRSCSAQRLRFAALEAQPRRGQVTCPLPAVPVEWK